MAWQRQVDINGHILKNPFGTNYGIILLDTIPAGEYKVYKPTNLAMTYENTLYENEHRKYDWYHVAPVITKVEIFNEIRNGKGSTLRLYPNVNLDIESGDNKYICLYPGSNYVMNARVGVFSLANYGSGEGAFNDAVVRLILYTIPKSIDWFYLTIILYSGTTTETFHDDELVTTGTTTETFHDDELVTTGTTTETEVS